MDNKKLETITFRCTKSMKDSINIIAQEDDRTLSQVIFRILKNYLRKEEVWKARLKLKKKARPRV